jgi:DNA replication ATP-dependent helicase Dna2
MIVLEEIEHSRGINNSVRKLKSYIKKAPRFSISEIENVLQQISVLPDHNLDYYNYTSIQISREMVAGKTGRYSDNRRSSYNSIWCDKDAINNISGLTLTGIESEKGYLDFKRSDIIDSPIRKGDAIILFRTNDPDNNCDNWFEGQVLKAAVKSINSENIEVSLRNKLINYSVFKGQEDEWSLAQDYFDSTLRKLHSEAFRFVQSPDFESLTGSDFKSLITPAADAEGSNISDFNDVTQEQNRLLKKAICANKLYFLEGPPGTGKTRYFISNLMRYYFFNTDKKILLVSFTNRAVDEATVATMKALGEENHNKIIRYGSRGSSEAKEVLFPEILDQYGTRQTYRIVRDCRVYCSTVASLISNRDIFQLIDFDVAIVDEAGQIAEYYMNILLGRIEKTILIGDSKQLPPIKISNRLDDIEKSESIIDVRMSYFTRMVSLIKKEDTRTRESILGMLTYQGRMDNEIMKAANLLSYENTLKSIYEEDRGNPQNLNGINFKDITSEINNSTINKSEAEAVVNIAVLIYSKLDSIKNDSIGIIAPYRMQCALIRQMLPLELLPYITVDTVERYQGSERDHIILSTVISDIDQLEQITSNDSMEMVSPSTINTTNSKPIDRKLNVAITRARHSFTLVGNLKILSFDNNYRLLIENFKVKDQE